MTERRKPEQLRAAHLRALGARAPIIRDIAKGASALPRDTRMAIHATRRRHTTKRLAFACRAAHVATTLQRQGWTILGASIEDTP